MYMKVTEFHDILLPITIAQKPPFHAHVDVCREGNV